MCGFDFSQKKMSLTLQQRVCIKFCVKNGFNGAQTLEMLEKCFGNDTRCRSGRESFPFPIFSYSVDSRNRSAERVTAPEMRSWKNRRWL